MMVCNMMFATGHGDCRGGRMHKDTGRRVQHLLLHLLPLQLLGGLHAPRCASHPKIIGVQSVAVMTAAPEASWDQAYSSPTLFACSELQTFFCPDQKSLLLLARAWVRLLATRYVKSIALHAQALRWSKTGLQIMRPRMSRCSTSSRTASWACRRFSTPLWPMAFRCVIKPHAFT